MSKIKIKGTTAHQQVESGFWSIIGEDGQQWRPVNMPEQLKFEGKKVVVTAREVEEEASIFMWGVPIRIIAFHTVQP